MVFSSFLCSRWALSGFCGRWLLGGRRRLNGCWAPTPVVPRSMAHERGLLGLSLWSIRIWCCCLVLRKGKGPGFDERGVCEAAQALGTFGVLLTVLTVHCVADCSPLLLAMGASTVARRLRGERGE